MTFQAVCWAGVLQLLWTPRGALRTLRTGETNTKGPTPRCHPGLGPPMSFLGPAVVEVFLSPREHRAKLVSTWGGGISPFTVMIHVVILLIWAAGLFFKARSVIHPGGLAYARFASCVATWVAYGAMLTLNAGRYDTKGPTPRCHPGSRPVDVVSWASGCPGVSISTGASGQAGADARGHV